MSSEHVSLGEFIRDLSRRIEALPDFPDFARMGDLQREYLDYRRRALLLSQKDPYLLALEENRESFLDPHGHRMWLRDQVGRLALRLTQIGSTSTATAMPGGDQVARPASSRPDRPRSATQIPRLFVGSSQEGLEVAEAIQLNLDRFCEVTVWSQGLFELTKSNLENLLSALQDSQFGAFVLTPDDVARVRDRSQAIPRDNVVFELGLFVGKLGRERCFIITPRQTELRLPSDLLGLTPTTYEPRRSDGNLIAALGTTCTEIKNAIKKYGR